MVNRNLGQQTSALFPEVFEVEEDGKYWLCNCKQTNNRPFCDGSHRIDEIQNKKL